MPTKPWSNDNMSRWVTLEEYIRLGVPHVSAFWNNPTDFHSVRIMARDDGTCLAIAKAYGADGAPMVAFGSGYGVVAALMALDTCIQGGRWREEKPWPGEGGAE